MIGSITPLVKEALITKEWARSALMYGVGSLLAAMSMGAALGILGSGIGLSVSHAWLLLPLALLIAMMELGAIPRVRPVNARQTIQLWRRRMSPARSAFWWGIDLGNGLSTMANYHSIWLLILACILTAEPSLSAMIFGGYGLGRALLVWTGPAMARLARGQADLVPSLVNGAERWHRLHGAAATAVAVIALVALL